MYPIISFGAFSFDAYLFMAALAFFASTLLVFLRRKSQNIAGWDAIFLSCIVLLGGVFGAKIFYIVGRAIQGQTDGQFWTIPFWQNFRFFVGFVWYGGVLGAALSLIIHAKILKISLKNLTDLMTPFALSFDGIARFGCLFAGCCYGVRASWGIKLHGVTRFPSPLFESALCLAVLVLLLIWRPERKRPGILLPIYLATYSIGRFFLEFFRGDESRGAFLIFSTSQWIAIGIVIISCVILYSMKQGNKQSLTIA